MLEQEKDWTELPWELIQLIAKKLADLIDFIHFRATCKAWRSSAPLSDPPPQLPWFLELLPGRYDHTYGSPGIEQRYYSVSSCQTLTIRLTLEESERLWNPMQEGVFSHYLAFVDRHEDILSFLNPLTKYQFSLSLPRASQRKWVYHESCMVWIGTDPIHNRSINFVEMFRWACYDPHNNMWVVQKGFFDTSCYWQGMFFTTDPTCETEVFDVSSKKLLHKIPQPEDELSKSDESYKDDLAFPESKSYLVESLGIILRVSCFYKHGDMENSIFQIYRL